MDNGIKKKNSAIDKAEQIALGAKYEEDVKNQENSIDKNSLQFADRKTAETQVAKKQRKQKLQEKKNLKRLKVENRAKLKREKAEEKAEA